MKKERKIENAKLGVLVLASLIFLVFSLYLIGKNQNIFGSSIKVIAEMQDVNGLLPGNNVRFKGMDIGTVSGIDMKNDSIIHVELLIHKSMQPYIKNNSKTTINTDGLMGNKILHINQMEADAPFWNLEIYCIHCLRLIPMKCFKHLILPGIIWKTP
ncbi:MlaD family protein [Algoriphagus halophilus]|uniref:MlaD family protein n=1 Tax=Algoriphagus halophilus TaxID=226505 RepID=UPI00358FD0D7